MKEYEEDFRSLFNQQSSALLVVDPQGWRLLDANSAAERLYQFSNNTLDLIETGIAEAISSLLHPESVLHPESHLHSVSLQRGAENAETPSKAKAGERAVVRQRTAAGDAIEVEMTLDQVEFGGRPAVLVTSRRIAAPAPAPPPIGRAGDWYEKAFQSSPLAISINRMEDKRHLEVNDAYLDLMGLTRAEVMGRSSSELQIYTQPEIWSVVGESLGRTERPPAHEVRIMTRNGKDRVVLVRAEPLELNGIACVLLTYDDITEIKSVEEQLRQAQKMEAVGRLAGGMAHDFNNLLGVIMGYCDLMQLQLKVETALPQAQTSLTYISRIHSAADRAAALTRRLLIFSQKRAALAQNVELNRLIKDMSVILQRLIGESVELVLRLDDGLGSVRIDPVQVEQIIMNLAVNARDAMPEGGKLVIETANVEVEKDDFTRRSTQAPDIEPGSYVALIVADTGWGIPADVKPHIFEPFFSTKAPGRGTGLGLAIVYGAVKQNGGSIWVYSDPGWGTTFKIYLPRCAAVAASSRQPHDPAVAPTLEMRASETILLVEDDEALREVTRKILEDGGYTVLEAAGAGAAMEIAAKQANIHVLLTDLVMPGMSGNELARLLLSKNGKLRVLYTSGYAGDTIPEKLREDADFIEKPFTRNSLLRRLREVIDDREAA